MLLLAYHQPLQPGFPCGGPDMGVEGLCNDQARMNAKTRSLIQIRRTKEVQPEGVVGRNGFSQRLCSWLIRRVILPGGPYVT